LETFIQNRIREITATEDCDEVKLGDLCSIDNGYAFKTTEYTTHGVCLLSIKHIPDFNFSKCNYIPENTKYSRFSVFQNDLLIALTGNTIGKYGIYKSTKQCYLNQRVARIRIPDINMRLYLFYYFELIQLQQQICGLSNNTAQANISSVDIETHIKIKLPKNRQLITELEPVFEEIERLQQEIHVADELYQTRIQELVKEALPEQPLIINETPVLENTFIETEIQDDVTSVAESVATASEKPTKKPRAKKEPKEKVAKEPKPKKETKPRKPRAKKETTNDKETEPK